MVIMAELTNIMIIYNEDTPTIIILINANPIAMIKMVQIYL